ncbi:somatostatin receptor type 5 [Microcaecilia unicolor]|uniref:Somatostatin receptor type 5-like n=1 Tax=Microcaecilia unicolor TaxID=1415580 RepID=A0A6P7YT87_9AMPH|nr:somatostatin receptor type 5-like [Microcaecilia unicolor]XP_030068172.1 somatostatin receptor type 5-like [Microcaecilia unicolor]XP_030068173.1 somatostatin receptor type 5-like [Microcaecilia unicolor]
MESLDTDYLQNDSLLLDLWNFTESYEVSPDLSTNTIVTSVFLLLICVIGCIGNTLVFWAIFRYVKMKTVTNIYILNVAAIDLLNALVLPFDVAHNILKAWPFGSVLCKFMWIVHHNLFPRGFFLTVMSVDCCVSVYRPMMSNKWRKARVVTLICATVWVSATLLSLPAIIYADVHLVFQVCTLDFSQDIWAYSYDVYTFTVGILVPLQIIGLCFFLIAVKVRSSGQPVGSPRCGSSKGSRKALFLTIVFLICCSPIQILLITHRYFPLTFDWLLSFFYVLASVRICANPIVCGLLFNDFHESFRTILCFWRKAGAEASDPRESKEENSYHQESMLA